LLSVNKRRLIPLARVGKTMTYDADRRRNPSPIHTPQSLATVLQSLTDGNNIESEQ
jgi:hypothetical protein